MRVVFLSGVYLLCADPAWKPSSDVASEDSDESQVTQPVVKSSKKRATASKPRKIKVRNLVVYGRDFSTLWYIYLYKRTSLFFS